MARVERYHRHLYYSPNNDDDSEPLLTGAALIVVATLANIYFGGAAICSTLHAVVHFFVRPGRCILDSRELFLFIAFGGLTQGLAWPCKLRTWLGEWSDACREFRRPPCASDDEGIGEGSDEGNEISTQTSSAIEFG